MLMVQEGSWKEMGAQVQYKVLYKQIHSRRIQWFGARFTVAQVE